MSWQQPQGPGAIGGAYNTSAPAFVPRGAQPYQPHQQQQQQQYYGGGGYPPQHHHQQQQHQYGGYGGYDQQQSWNGGGGGGGYQQYGGGYNNQYNPQQHQHQQQQPEPVQQEQPEPPKPSQSDLNKLTLGGAKKKDPIVMPRKARGAKLNLGSKADNEITPVAKKAEEEGAGPKKDEGEVDQVKTETTTSAPTGGEPTGSPTQKTPTTVAAAAAAATPAQTMTERRDQVRKELLKKRSKTEYVRDPRPHFNIVFCGHVDAGKSTISGHLLSDCGVVDDREMAKLKREAETLHREGWEYAYVLDVSEEERAKGKTHETGAAYFETKERRVTVLDAPGHKAFVPSMIGGATQAEIVVMVISARTGEFETGFDKGGQTREHTLLVRTCGVKHMICVVNKMDECNWDKQRYDEIVAKLRPFFKQNGFEEKTAKNLTFMPVAGLLGINLVKKNENPSAAWYDGPILMDYINNLTLPETRSEEDALAIPLVGAYKDDGKVFVYGKCESGSVVVGDRLQVLPTKTEVVVEAIQVESTEIDKCYPGDNVHVRVKGVEDLDIHSGFVLTSIPTVFKAVEYFQARIHILDVKNIICAGSKMMLHVHYAEEEVTIHKILAKVDKKTNEVIEKEPSHCKAGDVIMARLEVERSLVVETHKEFDKLGRIMLREDGKTIAIGVVTRLYESTKSSMQK